MGCNSSRAANASTTTDQEISSRTRRNLQIYRDAALPLHGRRRSTAGNPHIYFYSNNTENPVVIANHNPRTRSTPREEYEQLQVDLLQLERFFQTILEHTYGAAFQNRLSTTRENRENGCPPAANRIIESLPSVLVTENEIKDENTKECCICFLEHEVDESVVKLPCGHFYHKECIVEWLQKHCTCPVCRWELETDDAEYEEERLKRMNSRICSLKSSPTAQCDPI